MNNKLISQNQERYTKEGNNWKISASKDIQPIYLPIGKGLENIKPLISADGILIKVGEDYLCSPLTLQSIKESNNPHYDIVQNGSVKVKTKEVVIGSSIKIIELDISKLQQLADSNRVKGLKAGVSDTEYIYEGDVVDGISKHLIEQINYTLTSEGERGIDNFTLYRLKLAPDEAYSVQSLSVVQQDESNNGLLDTIKLKVFTEGVSDRLKLLREDFNMIKRMFFDGEVPTNDGKVTISSGIKDPLQRYSDIYDDNHQVVYKEVNGVPTIKDTPLTSIAKLIQDRTNG